ncbi:ScbA/BarX family gamma-butyrolactone biosynthesis protein [Streptomyces sp. NPDC059786]|uniref:ScbA/BarX family gamma-butyrolactone biosynthesis protein n=1 Tax=Streptomyces sp. NPDC059786 TaxID=3346946 RepID=UPI0036654CD5
MTTIGMNRAPDFPRSPAELRLDYRRTVDRLLVHREALGEVFLTDMQPLDDGRYAAGAQLPRSHAHYGDHLLRPASHDPLLILEACRQATLAGAHRFFAVATDNKFILTHLRLRLTDHRITEIGAGPCPLAMEVEVVRRKERHGRVTGLDYAIRLSVRGGEIGTAEIGLRFKTPEGYRALRLINRGGRALVSSDAYRTAMRGTPTPPYLVGRALPENVVLADAVSQDGRAKALLRVPADHPSLFDHPQDHLPGMAITEGARQLALFAAVDLRGMSAAKTLLTELDVTFVRFGELEEETVLSAELSERIPAAPAEAHIHYTQGGPLEPETAGPATGDDRVRARIEAHQGKELLCAYTFVLTPTSY